MWQHCSTRRQGICVGKDFCLSRERRAINAHSSSIIGFLLIVVRSNCEEQSETLRKREIQRERDRKTEGEIGPLK